MSKKFVRQALGLMGFNSSARSICESQHATNPYGGQDKNQKPSHSSGSWQRALNTTLACKKWSRRQADLDTHEQLNQDQMAYKTSSVVTQHSTYISVQATLNKTSNILFTGWSFLQSEALNGSSILQSQPKPNDSESQSVANKQSKRLFHNPIKRYTSSCTKKANLLDGESSKCTYKFDSDRIRSRNREDLEAEMSTLNDVQTVSTDTGHETHIRDDVRREGFFLDPAMHQIAIDAYLDPVKPMAQESELKAVAKDVLHELQAAHIFAGKKSDTHKDSVEELKSDDSTSDTVQPLVQGSAKQLATEKIKPGADVSDDGEIEMFEKESRFDVSPVSAITQQESVASSTDVASSNDAGRESHIDKVQPFTDTEDDILQVPSPSLEDVQGNSTDNHVKENLDRDRAVVTRPSAKVMPVGPSTSSTGSRDTNVTAPPGNQDSTNESTKNISSARKNWWRQQTRGRKLMIGVGGLLATGAAIGGVIYAATSDNDDVTLSAIVTPSPTDTVAAGFGETPTVNPTQRPEQVSTSSPTDLPTADSVQIFPSEFPTQHPSQRPTERPVAVGTDVPTNSPTVLPIEMPSYLPTSKPTEEPLESPSSSPSYRPTVIPTIGTDHPTGSPISIPTEMVSYAPTTLPTGQPSNSPGYSPTSFPSNSPTVTPTTQPTVEPSDSPTHEPSSFPSQAPTLAPTGVPTHEPSTSPTGSPTLVPTAAPTTLPSLNPTASPTHVPTAEPSQAPSESPTGSPTPFPTAFYVGDFDVSDDSDAFHGHTIVGNVIVAAGSSCCFLLRLNRCFSSMSRSSCASITSFETEWQFGYTGSLGPIFPNLLTIQGNLIIEGADMETISFPQLLSVTNGSIFISDNPLLKSVDFEGLESIDAGNQGRRFLSNFGSENGMHRELQSIPILEVGGVAISNNPELIDISMPSLQTVDSSVMISSNDVLNVINVKSFLSAGYNFLIQDNPFLSALVLFLDDMVAGGNIYFPTQLVQSPDKCNSNLTLSHLSDVAIVCDRLVGHLTIESGLSCELDASAFLYHLRSIEGNIVIEDSGLECISFPRLQSVEKGRISIRNNTQLRSIQFPELLMVESTDLSALSVYDNVDLNAVDVPRLETIQGGFEISGANDLETVNLGSLHSVTGDLVLSSTRGILDELALSHDYTIGGSFDLANVHRFIGDVTIRDSKRYAFACEVIEGEISVEEKFYGPLNASDHLPGLKEIKGHLHIRGTNATSVSFPDLTAVRGGSIIATDNGILAEVNFQNLAEIVVSEAPSGTRRLLSDQQEMLATPSLEISHNPALESVHLEKFTNATEVSISGNAALETLTMSNLVDCAKDFSISGNDALQTINLPNVKSVGGSLKITSSPALVTAKLGSVASIGGALRIDNEHAQFVGLGSLTHVVGTLKIRNIPVVDLSSWPDTFFHTVQLDCGAAYRNLSPCTISSINDALRSTCRFLYESITSCNRNIELSSFCTIMTCESVGGNVTVSELVQDVVQPFVQEVGGIRVSHAARTLYFGSLQRVRQDFSIKNTTLSELHVPTLWSIGRHFNLQNDKALTTVRMSNLTRIGGNVGIQDNVALEELDLDHLAIVHQSVTFSDNDLLPACATQIPQLCNCPPSGFHCPTDGTIWRCAIVSLPTDSCDGEVITGNLVIADSFTGEFDASSQFPNLREVTHSILADGVDNLVSFKMDSDMTVGVKVWFNENPALVSVDMSSLTSVANEVYFHENGALVTVNMSSVTSIGDQVYVQDNDNLATVDMSSLKVVGDQVSFYMNYALLSLDMGSLTSVGDQFWFNGGFTTLDVGSLSSVGGRVAVSLYMTGLDTVDMSSLIRVGGDVYFSLSVSGDNVFGTVDVSSLASVGSGVSLGGNGLATVDFSSLTSIGGKFWSNTEALEILDMSSLITVGAEIFVYSNIALKAIDMSSLTSVGEHIQISGNDVLETVNMSSLTSVGLAGVAVSASTSSSSFADVYFFGNDALNMLDLSSLSTVGRNARFFDVHLPGCMRQIPQTCHSCPASGFFCPTDGSKWKCATVSSPTDSCDGNIISGSLIIDGSFTGQFDLRAQFPNLQEVANGIIVGDADSLTSFKIDSELTCMGSVRFYDTGALLSIDMSGLTRVGKEVWITKNDALVTVDISSLTSVDDQVRFYNNPALRTADMSSLTSVGEKLYFYDHDRLDAVYLSSLTNVGDEVNFQYNYNLRTLDLSRLVSAGLVNFFGNRALTTVALSSLTTTTLTTDGISVSFYDNEVLVQIVMNSLVTLGGGIYVMYNRKLETVEMSSLTSVGGTRSLDFRDNDELRTINMDSLTNVGGHVAVSSNAALEALYIGSIRSVDSVSISTNPQLPTCMSQIPQTCLYSYNKVTNQTSFLFFKTYDHRDENV